MSREVVVFIRLAKLDEKKHNLIVANKALPKEVRERELQYCMASQERLKKIIKKYEKV